MSYKSQMAYNKKDVADISYYDWISGLDEAFEEVGDALDAERGLSDDKKSDYEKIVAARYLKQKLRDLRDQIIEEGKREWFSAQKQAKEKKEVK